MRTKAHTDVRTQIDLSAAQPQALSLLALQYCAPQSEQIRAALGGKLTGHEKPQMSHIEMLRMAQGAFKDRAEMDAAAGYVDQLRGQGAARRAQALQTAWEKTT